MACKEIFIDSTSTGNGRIVRNSDGSIKEMLTQHKKKSKLWDSINKSTDKEVLDTVDMVSGEASFDNELFALIKAQMGLEGNIAKDKKIEVLKLMLYAKAISENVLKEAPYKSEIDKGIAEPKLDVVKGKLQVILTAGVRVALRGNPQLFEGKAKLEYYKKLENNSAIWALDAMIKKDPRVIQSIIDDMAGSADASNISSQLLSAATDNAKELILGRIGSNEDTNGIITAMLLMGYELSTIIDFLDDADIKHVLEGMEIRRNGGDFATLSSSIVKELGDAGSDSINTLLRVFEVSESIMAFGGIRSLSENFKIDTVSIKRILEGIDVHNLRKAIKENDITMLYHAEGGMGNKVFNPELLIFLHPQSRMIFNRLYDLEYNMLPAMFPSIKPMDIFFEGFDARTEVAEKRLLDFIDSKKIGSFIKQKGLTGELPNPITGVVEYYDLSVTANRERYVQNFPAYIKKMRYDALTTFDSKIRPFKSPVLDSLSFYTGTNGAAPIVSIPGLGSKVHNDTYDSSIKAAYDELLVEIKDIDTPATLALKESLHSNLSLYALLTSNGRIRDRDMLSLMPEISTELAKHSKSLDESFYEEILHIVEVTEDIQNRLFRQATFRAKSNKSPAPTRQQMPEIGKKAMINKEFKDLVLGETPLFNVVAENVEKARAKARLKNGQMEGMDPRDMGDMGNTDNGNPGDDIDPGDMNGEGATTRFVAKPKPITGVKTIKALAGKFFRDGQDLYLGAYNYTSQDYAVRIFPAAEKAANPFSTLETNRELEEESLESKIPGVSLNSENTIADAGMRIGYPAKLTLEDGDVPTDVLILNFIETKKTKSVIGSTLAARPLDFYRIMLPDTSMLSVTGIELMAENQTLGLSKKTIGPITAYVSRQLGAAKLLENQAATAKQYRNREPIIKTTGVHGSNFTEQQNMIINTYLNNFKSAVGDARSEFNAISELNIKDSVILPDAVITGGTAKKGAEIALEEATLSKFNTMAFLAGRIDVITDEGGLIELSDVKKANVTAMYDISPKLYVPEVYTNISTRSVASSSMITILKDIMNGMPDNSDKSFYSQILTSTGNKGNFLPGSGAMHIIDAINESNHDNNAEVLTYSILENKGTMQIIVTKNIASNASTKNESIEMFHNGRRIEATFSGENSKMSVAAVVSKSIDTTLNKEELLDARLNIIYRGLDRGIYSNSLAKASYGGIQYIQLSAVVQNKLHLSTYSVTSGVNGNYVFKAMSEEVKKDMKNKGITLKFEKTKAGNRCN